VQRTRPVESKNRSDSARTTINARVAARLRRERRRRIYGLAELNRRGCIRDPWRLGRPGVGGRRVAAGRCLSNGDPARTAASRALCGRLRAPCLLCRGWASGAIPIPVESANHPFASCTSQHIDLGANTIEYDIACPGRDSARAHASYRATDDGFVGRVAMIMGAKNMTMTEVVRARRLGACNETAELAPGRI
jgi:hypothetical protein